LTFYFETMTNTYLIGLIFFFILSGSLIGFSQELQISSIVDSGSSRFDDSGEGIFGRKVVHRNIGEVLKLTKSLDNAKIVSKICIDREGKISSVQLSSESSTIANQELLTRFKKALFGYRFQPNSKAYIEECGLMIFNFER